VLKGKNIIMHAPKNIDSHPKIFIKIILSKNNLTTSTLNRLLMAQLVKLKENCHISPQTKA